jgi:hypothetical protein
VAWIKVDDHFDEHPKLAAVGPVGWGVWLAGLAYCNRNLTDGFIPRAVADSIGGRWRVYVPTEDGREQVWTISRSSGMHGEDMDTAWVADLLVQNGLWEEVEGGYRVHDYLDYQPSRAEVMASREADRKRKGIHKESGRNPGGIRAESGRIPSAPNPDPNPNPNPDPDPDPMSSPPGADAPSWGGRLAAGAAPPPSLTRASGRPSPTSASGMPRSWATRTRPGSTATES